MGLIELAINNYNSAFISISLFFIFYRYYINPIELNTREPISSTQTLKERGESVIRKLREVWD